jgi:hypothetical protein
MRILVVGDGHSAIHEVAVAAAFKHLGNSVEAFYWQNYFSSSNPLGKLWRRAQNKFLIGPTINRLNCDLVKMAVKFEPELIFVYRGTHITRQSLFKLKTLLPGCKVFGYNNDDPFGEGHPPWLWLHFLRSVPIYDIIFAYRRRNIVEYLRLGAKRSELLMPWFRPSIDKPLEQDEPIKKKYDVVFVGHYENDGRLEYFERISQVNFVFGLFGPGWNLAPKYDWLKSKQPIIAVRDQLYRETILSSKIALCFFSKLNRDTYTRRCFEIPAMGVCMLCQYSDDLAQIFTDGVDAVFFRNADEMMSKLVYYIKNDQQRERIAANGRLRVLRNKHDIYSRLDYVLNFVAPS